MDKRESLILLAVGYLVVTRGSTTAMVRMIGKVRMLPIGGAAL